MKPVIAKLMKAAIVAVGFYAALVFFDVISKSYHGGNYIENTIDLSKFRQYEAFDPSLNYRKYGFISSSFYAQTGVYNQADGKLVTSPYGYIGRIGNHILENEYETRLRFYDVGRSGTSSLDHLWFLMQYVTAPGAEGVIYTNGYSSLDEPYQKKKQIFRNYSSVVTLRELGQKYPAIAEHSQLLIGFIDKYGRSKMSVNPERYWEFNVGETFGVIDNDRLLAKLCFANAGQAIASTTQHCILNSVGVARNNLGSDFIDYLNKQYSSTDSYHESDASMTLNRLYSKAFFEYGDTKHNIANMIERAAVLSTAKPEAKKYEEAFYEILVGVTRAEGLKLVFYYPPMYELTPYQYWYELRPHIEMLKAKYNKLQHVEFIDHTFLPTINHFDAFYRKRGKCGALCKKNHSLGITGNVKRLRALFAEFEKRELLEPSVKPVGTAFKEEPLLPYIDMCFNIIGLQTGHDCHFHRDDYLEMSSAANQTLRQRFPNAVVTNKYIKELFYQ